tara:strand:- start:290 stop:535 length:246 start_codon:yes stop_codon:yes gene_type:complete
MDTEILEDLDNAVTRSKEITKIVGKLQSAFYTNDEQKIEDYLELTRTYSQYAIDELDTVVKRLEQEVSNLYSNVIEFPKRS